MFSRFDASRRAGAILALTMTGSMAACGGAAIAATSMPAPSPIVVTCAAFEAQPMMAQNVDVRVGQQIVVRLCSNPSTGFSWQASSAPDGVVRFVGQSDEAAPTGGAGQPGLVGAAGTAAFTFEAVAAGSGEIRLVYGQSWAGGTKGAWELDLHVVVA